MTVQYCSADVVEYNIYIQGEGKTEVVITEGDITMKEAWKRRLRQLAGKLR